MSGDLQRQGGNIVYFRDTMKRTETHPRPTAGCLSVPLFNQRQKRSRLPLTSNPTENELCSAIDFNDDFADSSFLSGNMAYTQSHAQSQSQRPPVPVAPRSQWNHQPQQLSNQPARYPGTPVRGYAPVPHPHKPANTWSQHSAPGRQETAMPFKQGQSGSSYGRGIVHHSQVNMQSKPKPPNHQPHSVLGRQETFVPTNQRQTGTAYGQGNVHHSQVNMQSKPKPLNHQQLTVQQSLSRQTHGSGGVRQGGVSFSGPRFPPAAPEPQKQAPQWKFKSSSQCGPTKKVMIGFNATQPTLSQQGEMRPKSQQQKSPVLQMKSVSEKTLRILTVVIEGMRHWSQFKNKAPMLFELFATLDSAVTDGKYSAKHFLMRTGRDVVSCVFFENDHELPKIFRGLVHRCMGNYDQQSDTFTCVSVRLASRYEQKNSQEAIRASDEEMRQVVQSLSEI
ncbi:spermatogenesis-associated protein 22 isoform X2 [Alosa sapidissima]|uniref:spermatogenesis-associated protein 22 isoform X2 n=2 Tax=Alosa sapidissima TaxID=34773 RepID=UPI001C08D599|nr:spermatogenesis-associated protein 22 isoform X2 [Alosa sapidissima]